MYESIYIWVGGMKVWMIAKIKYVIRRVGGKLY